MPIIINMLIFTFQRKCLLQNTLSGGLQMENFWHMQSLMIQKYQLLPIPIMVMSNILGQ